MVNIQNEKLFVFIHIPKTGGTTLREIINNQYGTERFWGHDNTEADYQQMIITSNKNSQLKCLTGHLPYGIHQLIQRPCTYLVMLRNPIERVISLYYYWKRVAYKPVENLSFEEFVQLPAFQFEVSNGQTSFLSGNRLPDLQKAKENLKNQIAVPGIMEMFNESLFFIKNECNWNINDYEILNRGINRPTQIPFSKGILEVLKNKNELDIELYKFGKGLLETKIKQLDLNEKLEFDKFINQVGIN
ncbi:sulfotransferase family 2 domain-containing protein [Priestia sp. TRN 1309]|uniref:sulfotransferase family 2 domain-containing protein n=1 Tax=Priestia sp. TRN 1309 TaxID=3420729 RepID=UPI003D772893